MPQNREVSAQMSGFGRKLADERVLITAVAQASYQHGLSQVKIAERFGISRFKVARLLDRARAIGIVRIEILDDGLPDPVMAADLKEALKLDACHVVCSHGDPDEVRQQIGSMAARVLSDTVKTNEILGIGWGRTLTATVRQLESLPRLDIVQITGMVPGDIESSPIAIAQHVLRRSGGDVYPIYTPLYVSDADTANRLRDHPDIRSALTRFPSITTAILSVGSWDPPV